MKVQSCYGGVKFLEGSGPSLRNVEKLDMGAWPMIHYMSTCGLQVDLNHFAKMEVELLRDKEDITERVREIVGQYTNLDSPDQVSELLFKKLGLKQPRPRMTKSGDRESVDFETLVAIQHDHECIPHIMAFKEVSKLYGTYVKPMPKLARRSKFGAWRMYPNFGTTRIPSGRLNCKEPNLLAMPNRTARGRQVCEGFITDSKWVYLSVDLSQIEPRVIAHRSGDKALTNVYLQQEDIYSDYAISAFKIPDKRYRDEHGKWKYPGVDKKEHRFPSKTCVLAWFYRVTAKGLLEQMPVICRNCNKDATLHDCDKFEPLWNENNCQDLINAATLKYRDVIPMQKMDDTRARRYGYVWDDWGRILHVAAVKSSIEWVVSAALREAGNMPIQGTAQGPVKLSMAEGQDKIVEYKLLGDICNPLLQIHDELLFECREDMAEEVGALIVDIMEHSVRLRIPLKAEMAYRDEDNNLAKSWGKLKK